MSAPRESSVDSPSNFDLSANPKLEKFAMRISYIGTHYYGWQKQKGSAASKGPSIQETIEQALSQIHGYPLTIVGSGRTDSGVHASGQLAHFVVREKKLREDLLRKGLNSILPKDIRILSVNSVPLAFHAQRSALKKQYSYYFQQGPTQWPALKDTTWWVRKTLAISEMQTALQDLVGEHDFAIFQASGGVVKNTVRTILEASIDRQACPFPALENGLGEQFFLVRLKLVGTGFLKQMVRAIAGTLLEIGEGKRKSDEFRRLLREGTRADLAATAPSRGLWLEGVWYPVF